MTDGTVTVEASNPHHGTYRANHTISSGRRAMVGYNFTQPSGGESRYIRAYRYFDSVIASGEPDRAVIFLKQQDWSDVVIGGMRWDGSKPVWAIWTRDSDGGDRWIESSTEVSSGQWYSVELLHKHTTGSDDGECELWVDGVSVVSVGSLDNDAYTPGKGVVGIWTADTDSFSDYSDCVIIADSYIGSESSSGSADLSANLTIQNKSQYDLSANVTIRNKSQADLSGSVTIQNKSQNDLSANVTIQNKAQFDLSANITIRNKGQYDLSASATIQNKGSYDLSANTTIRNQSQADLSANFTISGIQSGQADLSSNVTIKNKGSYDLSANFKIGADYGYIVLGDAIVHNIVISDQTHTIKISDQVHVIKVSSEPLN